LTPFLNHLRIKNLDDSSSGYSKSSYLPVDSDYSAYSKRVSETLARHGQALEPDKTTQAAATPSLQRGSVGVTMVTLADQAPAQIASTASNEATFAWRKEIDLEHAVRNWAIQSAL
jgi:hypothetical protein